jgi:hypothetical protein
VCFDTLLALAKFEIDLLAGYERATACAFDVGEVHEYIVSVFTGDETKSLFVIEKFHGTCWHNFSISLSL